MARERRNRTRLHYAIPPVNKGAQRYVRYVGVAPSTDRFVSLSRESLDGVSPDGSNSFTLARDPTSPFRPCVADGPHVGGCVSQGTFAYFGFVRGAWRPWVILLLFISGALGIQMASKLM